MKWLIAGVFALMLLPATAVAGPPKWTDTRTDVEMRMQGADFYDCNAGSPTSLLVGAAALGLVLRRRR